MAATFTHLVVRNAGTDPATTGSVSPTAGGLLLAFTWTNSATDTFTMGGTLTGSWTQAVAPFTSGANTVGVYWCSNYGASGTISADAGAGTQTAVSVTHVAEAGVLKLAAPITQTGTFSQVGNVSKAFSPVPVYATWGGVISPNATTAPGTGYTELNEDASFTRIATYGSTTGADPFAVTVAAQANFGICLELAKLAAGSRSSFKTGWRR